MSKNKETKEKKPKKLFYIEIIKGYVFKVAIDALSTNIHRATVEISKKGFFIRELDGDSGKNSKSLWDINWEKKNFNKFEPPKKRQIFSFNIKQALKVLKSVKKKDSIILYVQSDQLQCLCISIIPILKNGMQQRAENFKLSINYEKKLGKSELPDFYIENDIKKCAYGDPMVVTAVEFQKIKKLVSLCNTNILITMQKSNYLCFGMVGDDTILGADLEFGELLKKTDYTSSESSENDGDNQSHEEYLSSSENENNNSTEDEDEDEETSGSEDNEHPYLYKKEFGVSLFAPLIKLPGLCERMEFYAPLFPGYPLKISMETISNLGPVKVYIKDTVQAGKADENRRI